MVELLLRILAGEDTEHMLRIDLGVELGISIVHDQIGSADKMIHLFQLNNQIWRSFAAVIDIELKIGQGLK